MLLNLSRTPNRRETRRRRLRPVFQAGLLLALVSLFGVTVAGCGGNGPFSAPVQVAETPEKAFADGKDKQEAAQKALDANRRDDAAKLWGETASYYQAMERKYAGTETGLQALIDQTTALEKQVDASTKAGDVRNYQNALNALRSGLKRYPAYAFKPDSPGQALHEQARKHYDDLVVRMDEENSKSTYYKIMDTLVQGITKLGAPQNAAPLLAILLIAIVVNLLTWPLVRKQMVQAKEFARYQPELNKLRDKYKNDPQELFTKQQAFMKEHGINQFAGCLPALASWPITALMYYVIVYYQFHFRTNHFLWVNPAAANASLTWPAPLTGVIGHNLSEQDLPLLFLYAAAMWVQGKITPVTPNADPAVIEQQKMMTNMMPLILLIFMFSWQPPAAFVVYWIISIFFSAARYWYINRSLPNLPPLVLNADGTVAGGGSGSGSANDVTKPMTANPKLISPKNRPQNNGNNKRK